MLPSPRFSSSHVDNPARARLPQTGLWISASLGWLLLGCGQSKEPAPTPGVDQVPEELAAGNWNRARSSAPTTIDQQDGTDELANLGYADGVQEAPDVVMVTQHDPALSFAGLNFYVSGQAPEAFLIDMEGQVQHHWSYEYEKLWQGLEVNEKASGIGKWRRAHMYPSGDILAIHEGIGMIRLDSNSKLLWEFPGLTHHDMHVTPDDHIWVLGNEIGIHPSFNEEQTTMDDVILELDAGGQELRRVSILECVKNGAPELLERIQYRDLFHTNSIEVLDGSIADRVPEFAEGNVLVSLRHVDAVVVIDLQERKVVWSLSGDFRWQHDAQITAAGSLLLFDNHRLPEDAPQSSILEFDPLTKEQIWSFIGNVKQPFYSKTCGTTQRLGNGNTLIAESDGGRAFEITPKGEIVWEYYNPHRGGPGNEFIACLFALHRMGQAAEFDWLQGVPASEE